MSDQVQRHHFDVPLDQLTVEELHALREIGALQRLLTESIAAPIGTLASLAAAEMIERDSATQFADQTVRARPSRVTALAAASELIDEHDGDVAYRNAVCDLVGVLFPTTGGSPLSRDRVLEQIGRLNARASSADGR